MKTSILQFSLALLAAFGLASTLSTFAYGQNTPNGYRTGDKQTSTGSSVEGTTAVSCPHEPCTSALSGRKSSDAPHDSKKFTPAQLEVMRYGQVFSEIAAQERMAQSEEDAGNIKAAASWHGYFAAESGLTQEEAAIVKKIGDEYGQKAMALQAKRIQVILAARHANPGVRMSRFNSLEIAAVEEEIDNLLPNTKAELILALGSKSFTRFESYSLHRLDNARILSPLKVPLETEKQRQAKEAVGAK
jgi:hypothetical protein